MEQSYLSNFSYLFVPFTTEKMEDFAPFCRNITQQNGWLPVETDNRYLHRYVAERIANRQNAVDYQFRVDPQFADKQRLFLGTNLYSTAPKNFAGQKNKGFQFQIADVKLFTFNTGVCILAFELRFLDNDPLKIASAQYYLRKISKEKIYTGEDKTCGESFEDISRRILGDAARDSALDFFFYATPKNEKANFLTYIDVPKQTDYSKELFYLKWCYKDGIDYSDDSYNEDSINYVPDPCTAWGISVSAAVCLVYRSERQKNFIETVFQKNFRQQYLLTYILLLHQKYMLYLFLTKLSAGLEGNLQQLKSYKERLYYIESHYLFSNISEVPQYQRFYAKVRKIFAIDQLFIDVQEPLTQLAEMQHQKAESEQQARDHRVSTALATLSLLTIVSALTDASGITANLGWLIPEIVSRWIQSAMLILVLVISIVMFIRLIFIKKE